MHDGGPVPPPVLIAEAKDGLSAFVTGEQVYFQRSLTFTDVPDTADFAATIGVHFGDLLRRWMFSVSGASVTGFVAEARERDDSDAEHLTVTLTYSRGEPITWHVSHRPPRRPATSAPRPKP